MGEHSTDPLIGAFLTGHMKCLSKRMAGISRAQDLHQASIERHILISGQILEAVRQMAPPHQTSGRRAIFRELREHFENYEWLLQGLWRLYRAVPWGWLLTILYALAKWLHVF